MNENQIQAIKTCMEVLVDRLDLGIIIDLRAKHVLLQDDLDTINSKLSHTERRILLLETIQNRDGAWDAFLCALTKRGQNFLRRNLEKNLPVSSKLDFIDLLKKLIERQALEPFRYWNDFLPLDANLNDIFHPLQIIRTQATRLIDDEKQIIRNYDYFKNQNCSIFFIEGDPGIGKSTYVSKLAYDWATKNDELCKIFDAIFLIRCSKVDENLDLPNQISQSIGIAKQNLNSIMDRLISNRTLIIFDGYDENPLKIINQLINKPLLIFEGTEFNVFTKILVTSRGTHAPIKNQNEKNENNASRIERCDYWLKILGFSNDDIEMYLNKMNVNEEEKRAIMGSDSGMSEILRNPLFAMMCVCSSSVMKLRQLQSQQRLFSIFETFLEFYKEVCKKKLEFNEELYEKSFQAVSEFAAFQLADSRNINHLYHEDYLAHFKNYAPNMEIITLFGLVKCMGSKLSVTKVKMNYSFFHQTFLEYFAARWASVHEFRSGFFYSSPLTYFLISTNREIFSQNNNIYLIPYCAFSVQEINEGTGKPKEITLYEWKLDETNLPEFLKYFQSITFDFCNFERFGNEKKNQNLISNGLPVLTKMIKIVGINYRNLISLFTAFNLFKKRKFKSLKFFYDFDGEWNDSAIKAISEAPVFDFYVGEIFIRLDFHLMSKEIIIFFLILVGKFNKNIRRYTLEFCDSKDRLCLDALIQDDDKRLKAIDDQLGENFLINTLENMETISYKEYRRK